MLNNDLSSGVPGIVEELYEQYLLPPACRLGVRRKSRHFQSYEEVAKRFGKLLGIDPWLINPLFGRSEGIDFANGVGMEGLAEQVDVLLAKVRRKYKEYGIKEKPFAIVKADNGTYGMGVMTVRDAKELAELPRKSRNKMGMIRTARPCTT